MAKLFLFAIGGTGSRVVKALTMLLASGVEIKNTDTIIPIIIDPDSANGDLNRTVEILKTYKEIREKSFSSEATFFKTKIQSLDELGDGGFVSDTFKFDIDGVKEQLFKEFIGYPELDFNNRAFATLLFSKANLNSDMEVGFKGNPNIGSVVLNKFKSSDFFKKFAANFEENDRVFIISSIFGGTGAAGFPLILKNIREADHNLSRHSFLRKAKIGAVTVLPYFGVRKNEETSIDSNSFISKTKAALSYYARNVSGNKSINALYYIGDKVVNDQEGADGANKQKNKAHFIELASALAVIDFMDLTDTDLTTLNGEASNPKYFEFGLRNETNGITFNDLSKETYEIIANPLTQYSLFKSLFDNHYESLCDNKNEAWIYHGNNKLSKESLDSRFRHSLTQFNSRFNEWLYEMQTSTVLFNGIDQTKSGKDIYNLVNGNPHKKGIFRKWLEGSGLNHFRGVLSKEEASLDHFDSPKKLVALFSNATNKITTQEIKI